MSENTVELKGRDWWLKTTVNTLAELLYGATLGDLDIEGLETRKNARECARLMLAAPALLEAAEIGLEYIELLSSLRTEKNTLAANALHAAIALARES